VPGVGALGVKQCSRFLSRSSTAKPFVPG